MTKKDAGLTDAEDQLLKQVVKDWMAQNSAIGDQIQQLRQNTTLTPADRAAQTRALRAQYSTVTANAIDRLKTGFGPDRFAVLDAYVHSKIGAKMEHSAAAPHN